LVLSDWSRTVRARERRAGDVKRSSQTVTANQSAAIHDAPQEQVLHRMTKSMHAVQISAEIDNWADDSSGDAHQDHSASPRKGGLSASSAKPVTATTQSGSPPTLRTASPSPDAEGVLHSRLRG
jgi:hypothetical protein